MSAERDAGREEPKSVNSDQSAVTEHAAAGQKGNLTHDLNHNLVLSGKAPPLREDTESKAPPCTHTASGGGDTETPRSPAGTTETQGSPPEHDAAWYSPSARAARITQSMIEHRLRKRRVEM